MSTNRPFHTAEVFYPRIQLRKVLVPMMPALVALGVLVFILWAIVLSTAGAPSAVSISGSIALTVLALGLFVAWGRSRMLRNLAGMSLEVSPVGLRAVHPLNTAEIAWGEVTYHPNVPHFPDARTVSPFVPLGGLQVSAGSLAANRATAAIRNAGSPGVAGFGRLTTNGGSPDLQVQIPLSLYEPGWQQGRIGEWVRAHRPDLQV